MRHIGLLAVLVLLTLSTAGARADIPPPPGYVESCTAAIQQQPTEVCVDCGAYFGDPTHCQTDFGGERGHTQRCRTPGASTWTEVWCRPRTEADPAPTPPPATPVVAPAVTPSVQPASPEADASTGGMCSISYRAPATGGAVIAITVLALALVRRRRA